MHTNLSLENEEGTVYWITGLSGAGKTSFSQILYKRIKHRHSSLVLLDGDVLRDIFGETASYDLEKRLQLALRYAKLCALLAKQGVSVICATISMFDQCRLWNREHLKNYQEIYLRVPLPVLCKRDQKQLYSKAQAGEISHVMGIDIPFEEPKQPDFIIDNDGEKPLSELCDDIVGKFTLLGLI